MTHILHLDASPRGDRSISRTLSKEFITNWKAAHPNETVTYRDLGHHPVPLVDEPWIAAAYSAPDQHTPEQAAAIRPSNELVDEFLQPSAMSSAFRCTTSAFLPISKPTSIKLCGWVARSQWMKLATKG